MHMETDAKSQRFSITANQNFRFFTAGSGVWTGDQALTTASPNHYTTDAYRLTDWLDYILVRCWCVPHAQTWNPCKIPDHPMVQLEPLLYTEPSYGLTWTTAIYQTILWSNYTMVWLISLKLYIVLTTLCHIPDHTMVQPYYVLTEFQWNPLWVCLCSWFSLPFFHLLCFL